LLKRPLIGLLITLLVGYGYQTYQLAAHVHTHPMNGNQNTPSGVDKAFASSSNYPGLPKKIFNMRNIVDYDQNGETGRTRLEDECP
jgi:hypothetical protein